MRKEKRGGSPLTGLTVAAILLASTAGYVSALSRMFQSPSPFLSPENTFSSEETSALASPAAEIPGFQQAFIRTAPAWFVNAMPGYSSGRARAMWYLSLDSSGDRRAFDFSGGFNDTTSRNSFLLFDTRSIGSTVAYTDARTSGGVVPLGPLAATATGSWNADASDVWSNSARWASNVIADGAGSTGNFTFNITATRTITIDGAVASRTLGIMNIGDSTGGPSNYVIAASGGGTLTFDNVSANAQLNQTSTSGSNTISAPIVLNSSLDVTNASSNNLTLSGGISAGTAGTKTITSSTGLVTISNAVVDGSGVIAVLQNGPGTLALGSVANTYSGGTTIAGGTITIGGSGSPLGGGTLTLGGGTLTSSANRAAGAALVNNVVLTADSAITTTSTAGTVALPFSGTLTGSNGTLTIRNDATSTTGQFDVRFSGGNYTMSQPIVLDNGAGGGTARLSDFNGTGSTHTYTGVISGNGSYNRSVSSGAGGNTVFSANNTYTGSTTVSAGTLEIANTNSASSGRISGTSSVIVNQGGTLLLSGSSSFTDRINDNAGMTLNANNSATVAFNTGGLSEHGVNANSAGIGALTLQSSSIIDLSNGASILAFANSSAQTWTGTLKIYNWSGNPITGNGTDQLYFGNDATGLTLAQLSQISFYSDAGTTLLGTGAWGVDLDGEVVPTAIPEPGTWIGAGLALAAIAVTQRKRLAKRKS